MFEFGKTLRTAREVKGLSIDQLADLTHMTAKIVRELEIEDFSAFPAPIYGRGFVKLYCGAVGLDPKPFLDEFMEIYNGNRDLAIREREPAPEPPIAEAEPETNPSEATPYAPPYEEAVPPTMTFDRQETILERPAAAFVSSSNDYEPQPEPEMTSDFAESEQLNLISEPAPAQPTQQSIFDENRYLDAAASRYADPAYDEELSTRSGPSFSIPPAVWRLALLGIVACAILWGAFVGLKALYRSTCGAPGPEPAETAASAATEAKPKAEAKPKTEAKPASTRVPQKIPSLYID